MKLIVAEKFSELGLGVVGNLLGYSGAAVVANQSVGKIVFRRSGFGIGDENKKNRPISQAVLPYCIFSFYHL